MAYDPLEKKLIDPYDGKKDLEKRMIRFTREPEARIKEDPVRMIRACRFCAMIDGTFSIGSLDAILSCKGLLKASVAKERIRHEIMKAMALKQPSLFFRALRTTGLLAGIFPSLDRCYDLDGGPHHAETVFEHCLLVGDALPAKFPLMRLAGFLHDTGKFDAAEDTDGKQTFEGHETHVWATRKDLETLRFSAAEIAYILSLMQTHMRPLTEETTPKAARRLLAMLADHGLDYRAFMRMRIADKKGNLAKSPYTLTQIKVRLKKLIHEIQKETAFQKKDLQISGSDIMQILDMAPGPKIGEIKQQLFERVLDQPELNDYSELAMLCRSLNMKN
jgi:tRNA nucleotidyltransferase/poly(A) polymerase